MASHNSLYRYGLFLIPLLMVTASCGTLYSTPASIPMEPGMYSDFETKHQFSIKNVQTSMVDSSLGKAQTVKYSANYHKWTDAAIDVLKTELQKKGGTLSGDADKELRLSVTHANIVKAAWGSWCYLTLKVETGDGYSIEYKSESKGSAARVPTGISVACGRAITLSVSYMLNDQVIRDYIQG